MFPVRVRVLFLLQLLFVCGGRKAAVSAKESTTVYNCCKKDDPKCSNYKGTKYITSSGKKCQAWNQQSPHDHKQTKSKFDAGDFETNYCRNPDGEPGGAWCYTMDKDRRWEYCGIPTCQAEDVDECQPNPCVHGTCTDGVNSYTCQCSPGYRGDNCTEACQDLNEDCGLYTANGLCNYNSNGMDWEQYMNENCAKSCGICTESKCQPNPCVHGTCTDGVNSYTCQCSTGYRGDNCDKACQDLDEDCGYWKDNGECQLSQRWMNENCARSCGICTDIDDCQPNPCVHGTCTDGWNNYTCQCSPGYRGDNCDEDIDECQPNPCVHGICSDGVNSYTCQCSSGYKGDNCDEGGLREKRNNDDFVNEYETPKNCSFFIFGAGKTYEVVFKGKEQGYIGTYPAHWERARLACQRLGGDLAQPSTWEEQDKIEAALRKLPTNNMRCAQYYIGVKKDWTTGRGVPIWLSGQEMESDSGLKFEKYSSWFSNTTSACGAISAGGVVGGGATNQEGIKNVDCRNGSGVFGYVCEYANASPNCIP